MAKLYQQLSREKTFYKKRKWNTIEVKIFQLNYKVKGIFTLHSE